MADFGPLLTANIVFFLVLPNVAFFHFFYFYYCFLALIKFWPLVLNLCLFSFFSFILFALVFFVFFYFYRSILLYVKVQSCKLYNDKYMFASTKINSYIFVFIAVLVFKLLSHKVLFIKRKDNKGC